MLITIGSCILIVFEESLTNNATLFVKVSIHGGKPAIDEERKLAIVLYNCIAAGIKWIISI